jgi:hypothetical protein
MERLFNAMLDMGVKMTAFRGIASIQETYDLLAEKFSPWRENNSACVPLSDADVHRFADDLDLDAIRGEQVKKSVRRG